MDVSSDRESMASEGLDTADGLVRDLTRTAMPEEVITATLLAYDIGMLNRLDSPAGRATRLTQFEAMDLSPDEAARYTERHWKVSAESIQRTARAFLDGPRSVFCHFQCGAHRGACGKTPVVPRACRPRPPEMGL